MIYVELKNRRLEFSCDLPVVKWLVWLCNKHHASTLRPLPTPLPLARVNIRYHDV